MLNKASSVAKWEAGDALVGQQTWPWPVLSQILLKSVLILLMQSAKEEQAERFEQQCSELCFVLLAMRQH